MAMNDIRMYQKLKNEDLLSIEKVIIKSEKIPARLPSKILVSSFKSRQKCGDPLTSKVSF